MQDSDKSPQQSSAAAAAGADLVQLARRKAILRGMGKAAAVAGASVPLSSLATVKLQVQKTDGKFYHCSVSGNMSVMLSAGHTHVICTGKTPYSYKSKDGQCTDSNKTRANWPAWPNNGTYAIVKTSTSGGTVHYPNAQFNAVFGSGSTTKIGSLVNAGTSDEAHWVAALLNANLFDTTTFPHSPQEVISHYQNASIRSAAIAFYKLVNTT